MGENSHCKIFGFGDRQRFLKILDLPQGSIIWNFMMSCGHVITDHITWLIGDRKNANFWKDSWEAFLALGGDERYNNIKQKTKDVWG